MTGPADYEKLGAFYLGKRVDPKSREMLDELLLYDAKDLTTHAVCVGMTGSGKTGLCVSLLEEAAIDGVPTIAIDPKGDLPNLLLAFPELRGEDFAPWVDPGEAMRKGEDPRSYPAKVAEKWKKGLASWGQDGERIRRFRDSVDVAVYTPGSNAGLQLSALRSFDAPPAELRDDREVFVERISATVSGLLNLLGVPSDPVRSREHVFLSNVLARAWGEGRNLSIADLIREVQAPEFDRIGVLDVEAFYPSKERFELVMQLNSVIASPRFASWLEGEPIDPQRLLWTREGKPRISIISIAHLSDPERMFVVTILLNEIVAWMRRQPGTSSLAAILYMDEVFGYLPPVANPPSKLPLLTLLKQARAFGLGTVLATQNPVDLDYKALSNAGTWMLGRLQTERDKARVLDGLEGASAAAGAVFDRRAMDEILSGVSSRMFLLNNVHDDEPLLFNTRWAMSYLRGPVTKDQIRELMADRKSLPEARTERSRTDEASASIRREAPSSSRSSSENPAVSSSVSSATRGSVDAASERPVLPPDVPEVFLVPRGRVASAEILYRPRLLATVRLHFVLASIGLDDWRTETLLTVLEDDDSLGSPWEAAEPFPGDPRMETEARPGARFGSLPSEATRSKSYASWGKSLVTWLYRERSVAYWKCASPRLSSRPGEEIGDFRSRLARVLREERDADVEKLRAKYEPKLARLQERIRKAEAKIEKEASQYSAHRLDAVVSIGRTILGSIFGRRLGRSASSSVTRTTRAAQSRGDIARAREDRDALQRDLDDLDREFQEELRELDRPVDPMGVELEECLVRPRKSDISVTQVLLAWTPYVDGESVA